MKCKNIGGIAEWSGSMGLPVIVRTVYERKG